MKNPPLAQAPTNPKPGSQVDVKCDCHTMWSLAQQWSTQRLCVTSGELKGHLVENYAVRARRIAATYARFYLETEDGGDASKKGRFYWMALGAFASKTVACTLENWQMKMIALTGKKKNFANTVVDGLGKGNLWLFCDISGWHWYYMAQNNSFDMCRDSRNASSYVKEVRAQMKHLPWQAKALPTIKNFAVSKDVKEGFEKVKEFESTNDKRQRPTIQFDHLLAIANHEQGVILQPLIYDDPEFAAWVGAQRSVILNWASPELELVFTHACSTDNPALKSVAPEGTKLEVFESRMFWIRQAAKKFHGLMQQRPVFMEGELKKIAGWVDMPDTGKFTVRAKDHRDMF